MTNRWLSCVVLAFISVLCATPATSWSMTADELIKQTGIAGGLCSFPCAVPSDETLAFDLAKRPSFIVHLLSQDAALVARLRAKAEAEGIFGRSLYVETGDTMPLPFADRLVDVLVANDLRDANLTLEWRNELLRALAPRRGAAFMGRAKTAGDGLTMDALKAWIKDLPLAQTFVNDVGVYALLKIDLPPNSDSWSHRCHGPDNAQVSSDATFKWPFLTQWWGLPRQESFWGMTMVSSHGRLFSIRASRRAKEQVFLTARSLNNGVALWQKILRQADEKEKTPHGGFFPGRSCAVAIGDTLCLAEKDSVLLLNAETGEIRDRIAGPKPGGQVKWIASVEGMLAILAGEADVIKSLAYQTVATNPVGREIAVYDLASKRELWRDTTTGDIDERIIAARGKYLYCMVQDVGIVCRELNTGKIVWTSADAEVKTEFRSPDTNAVNLLLFSQPALLALEDVLLLRAKWASNLFALSREDGHVLWKKPSLPWGGKGDTHFRRCLTGVPVGKWWGFGGKDPLDLKTGEPVKVKGFRFTSNGCGPTMSTPNYLITCFGKVLAIKDKFLRCEDLKTPCDIGSIVSEGMLISAPSECGCPCVVKGYRVVASAGNIKPHTAPPWKERLTTLDATEPAALATTAADWLTYRHDAQRSGATTASVGAQPKILWQWKPAKAAPYSSVWKDADGPRLAPDFQAGAPVTAGGFVWFASHDGVIRCARADSGKEVWTFATGGMLFAAPTVWEGRLLVGDGNGRIHCLDAATGRQLWRFMASPRDRRIFWFGHLVGTWPITSGIVIQDGVAYAVAGYYKENGIHVYALNPKNGEVIWEKDNAGVDPWEGLSSLGNSAIGEGKLWIASSPFGYFDLKTGDLKHFGGYQFGGEVGVMNKWVFHGGRRISETQDTLRSPMEKSGFIASNCDSPLAQFKINDSNATLPVWDAELVIAPPNNLSGNLTALPMAKLLPYLASKFPGIDAADKTKPAPAQMQVFDWTEQKTWATEAVLPIAMALTKDQLIVACLEGNNNKLLAFRRDNGARDWSVDLPEQPVMNRLAIDRDGRILIALCDGSMLCLGK